MLCRYLRKLIKAFAYFTMLSSWQTKASFEQKLATLTYEGLTDGHSRLDTGLAGHDYNNPTILFYHSLEILSQNANVLLLEHFTQLGYTVSTDTNYSDGLDFQ